MRTGMLRGVREHARSSWRQHGTVPYDFSTANGEQVSSFGHAYDILTQTHVIVFADDARYVSLTRASDGQTRSEVLDVSNAFLYRTHTSQLRQGPDAHVHVMYRKGQQIVHRALNVSSSTWTPAQPVTPWANPANRDFDPLP